MAFQGSLAELPLPDIIQLVSVSGKTGRFDLSHESETGHIYLRDGQIVHAATRSLRGEEAVYELAIWSAGDFVFVPEGVPSQTTIDKSNTNLLMEAARRIDEWQVLSKRIASTRLVPVFTEESINTSVSFTPQEWALICRIDEQRTIEEIAITLGLSPFEACKQLYGLITAGLVGLRPGLSQRFGEALRALEITRAGALAGEIHQLALESLRFGPEGSGPTAPPSETLGRLDKALTVTRSQLASGRSADVLLDLVRAGERALSATRGPESANNFLDQIGALF